MTDFDRFEGNFRSWLCTASARQLNVALSLLLSELAARSDVTKRVVVDANAPTLLRLLAPDAPSARTSTTAP